VSAFGGTVDDALGARFIARTVRTIPELVSALEKMAETPIERNDPE
jgi:hypothetical protein